MIVPHGTSDLAVRVSTSEGEVIESSAESVLTGFLGDSSGRTDMKGQLQRDPPGLPKRWLSAEKTSVLAELGDHVTDAEHVPRVPTGCSRCRVIRTSLDARERRPSAARLGSRSSSSNIRARLDSFADPAKREAVAYCDRSRLIRPRRGAGSPPDSTRGTRCFAMATWCVLRRLVVHRRPQ